MANKNSKFSLLIRIGHWIGSFTPESFQQTMNEMIVDRKSNDYHYEFLLRSIIIFYQLSISTFMLLFNKQNDLYLMQFIHETFTFRIGFDPIFGTTMFSCHVLIFIFGLFILFVRYKMTFSKMGKQLISEVINKNDCIILKHCDPITLKNLNKIKHIGELFMHYGPIIYGSVFLAFCLAFMYLLYVFPQIF